MRYTYTNNTKPHDSANTQHLWYFLFKESQHNSTDEINLWDYHQCGGSPKSSSETYGIKFKVTGRNGAKWRLLLTQVRIVQDTSLTTYPSHSLGAFSWVPIESFQNVFVSLVAREWDWWCSSRCHTSIFVPWDISVEDVPPEPFGGIGVWLSVTVCGIYLPLGSSHEDCFWLHECEG